MSEKKRFGDSLRILPDSDIPRLMNVIESKWPYGLIAYTYLNNVINWKKRSSENYYTLMVPWDSDLEDGTFVCLMQFGCYELYVFTLQKSCDKLYRALIGTKIIDWSQHIYFSSICEDHVGAIKKAMEVVNVKIHLEFSNNTWVKEKEKTLKEKLICPADVYIAPLRREHIKIVNDLWPHRSEGSEVSVWTMVRMNCGYGVFLKDSKELVAWVIKNEFGCLGILQVADGHFQKGYGSLITKHMCKKLAEEGSDAVGFVIKSNIPSTILFTKLGFHVLYPVRDLFANHMPTHIPAHCLKN